MDVSALRYRLQQAPYDFLSALSSSATLDNFDKQWLSLRRDVDEALRLSLLNDEDMSLAHATAAQVAAFGQGFMEANDEAVKRTTLFVDAIEDVFAQLTISASPHTRGRRSLSSAPSHIPAAYTWIVHNLHDPYPPNDVKARISRDAGCPVRVITEWFKQVRRHIGWVSMCKKHFKGSRAQTVQAAKHVYLWNDSTYQVVSTEVVSQLEAIRTRLRDLYPIGDDNGDLSDSTDDSLTASSLSSRSSTDQSPYARSRSSSSTPSLIFSTDDEDDRSLTSFTLENSPACLGKRKSTVEEDEYRSLKRNRSGFISVADGMAVNVVSMSPAVSAAPSCGVVSESSPYLLQLVPSPSRKRRLFVAATEWEDTPRPPSECDPRPPLRLPKRRLSVSDSQPTPKRPCLPLAVGPRKQAVSTPIPIAHQTTPAVDDWFPFELSDTSSSVELVNWDGIIDNDAFLYNSLFDDILQSDGQDFSHVTPPSDAYQSPTPPDLGVSSAVDPSVLDISSAFTEPSLTQLTAPISTPPGPITATTPVFDFLDAFLSAVNAESAEPHTTQSSSSPLTELSLNDTIDLFGESVVVP